MHGRPPGAADGAAGHDSDGILALLPMAGGGGFDVVRAVKENPSAIIEVTSEHLKTADDWLAFLDAHGASLKDNERERNRAMVLFRRVSRLAVGCNGEAGADVPVWGTSVLLAVRRDERLGHAKTLVFFHDGAAAVDVGSTLQQRLACARGKVHPMTICVTAAGSGKGIRRSELGGSGHLAPATTDQNPVWASKARRWPWKAKHGTHG
jgi:hypothetical protein